jgi:hypothetical protein
LGCDLAPNYSLFPKLVKHDFDTVKELHKRSTEITSAFKSTATDLIRDWNAREKEKMLTGRIDMRPMRPHKEDAGWTINNASLSPRWVLKKTYVFGS